MRASLTGIYLSLFVTLYFQNGFAQTIAPATIDSAIAEAQRLVDSLRVAGNIPGLDVAISMDGQIVWSEAFGFRNLEDSTLVLAGVTQFRIGSVSKPITTTGLGLLLDQGKIKLDASIQEYVPYFPDKKFPITIRQIAGHLAGIRHYKNNEFLNQKHYPTVESGISIFRDDPLLFQPGTQYSYSSYGFNLISAAMESAAKQPFLRFMEQQVFTALEMKNTCPDMADSLMTNRTRFYYLDFMGRLLEAPKVDNSYKWAGGGFLSTTTDLIKFGHAHLGPGFLSEKTLTEFTSTQELVNGDKTDYGIGWRVYPGGYGHTGGSVGGITYFRLYPAHQLVIVLLSNASHTKYGNVPERIANMFIQSGN